MIVMVSVCLGAVVFLGVLIISLVLAGIGYNRQQSEPQADFVYLLYIAIIFGVFLFITE